MDKTEWVPYNPHAECRSVLCGSVLCGLISAWHGKYCWTWMEAWFGPDF